MASDKTWLILLVGYSSLAALYIFYPRTASGYNPPPPPPPPGTFTETVIVTNSSNLRLPGATVTLTQVPPTQLITDSNGTVVFTNVPAGTYNISVSLAGYPSVSLPPITLTASRTDTVVLTAPPPPPPAGKTGVIIPLYIYPGADWNRISAARTANPTVPIVCIVNPGNGVGTVLDPNYVSAIVALKSYNIKCIGYVQTSYGLRDPVAVKAEIDQYLAWYNIDGIMFDQMANTAGLESYYSTLNAYVKGKIPGAVTIGSPGTSTIQSYAGTVDSMIIYNNISIPANFAGTLPAWYVTYPKATFSALFYGVPTLDPVLVKTLANSLGYLDITSGVAPNPWGALPSYFEALVAALV